ncbi:hypothetical protein [Nonomuraea endophytica]|uniref:hypothetical protein n=1 Tax=Nonomuraea endophytica TaxID=714136 RepID=UPI0037C72BD4
MLLGFLVVPTSTLVRDRAFLALSLVPVAITFGFVTLLLVGAGVGDGALANRIAAAPEAFTGAWHALLWAIAVICTVAAVGIHTMLRRK